MKPLLHQPTRQRGLVALAMIVLLLLVGAYFMLGTLNFAAVRVDRDRSTTDSLLRAKEALIAYAVADANRPGELPCPDVNDDGQLVINQDFIGSACVSLIGRLPWRTLGLPDLRDDAGERLWYALSDDFHANGTVPLNSDTAFRGGHTSLSLTGLQSASNLAAIIFSPGAPLVREDATALQSRSGAGALVASNYLDFAGGESNSDGNRVFVSAPKGDGFNDRLMPIHSDDIMWVVERRAGREFAQKLREHYDGWKAVTGQGFYPWAAPFGDPWTMQAGQNGLEEGLLPLSASPVVWTSASISGVGGSCSGVGTTEIVCSAIVVLGFGGDVTGRIGNVGSAFIAPPDASLVTTSGLVVLGSPSFTWNLDRPGQSLDVSTAISFLGTGAVEVRARTPPTSAWISSPSWLVTNRWYELAYYAVAPAFAVNGPAVAGTQSCGTCVTVAGTVAAANKEAVVVMMGRALPVGAPPQAARPISPLPVALDQFLESANRTTGDRIFEHNLRGTSFNDLPIVVRP